MTQQAITLPYLRTSPLHIPRRDLVLSAADSLLLTVTVVESDHPNAQLLIQNTDENGPSMQLILWEDSDAWNGWCDYRRPSSIYGTPLLSMSGQPGDPGSWDFHIPTGSFADLPLRCGWSVLLTWDNGTSAPNGPKSSILAQGVMNVLRPVLSGVPISELIPIIPPIVPPTQPTGIWLVTSDTLRPIWTSTTSLQLITS